MKRLKAIFISSVIVIAIGSAYATRPCQACIYLEQYYYTGSGYLPAGEFGTDFYCLQYGGTCTYYKPRPIEQPFTYAPCRAGVFTPVP
jgi:hypothetical protein